MARHHLPPFLVGALQSAGIISAFVAFGLAWAGLFSLHNGHPGKSERPAIRTESDVTAGEIRAPWEIQRGDPLHPPALPQGSAGAARPHAEARGEGIHTRHSSNRRRMGLALRFDQK
jgi:hypothetical protein